MSGPPFFSFKRTLCPPGVTGNKGYMSTRWGEEDAGCAPSNARPEVVETRAYREAVSMPRHTGRRGYRAEQIVSQSVYDPSGTLQIVSRKGTSGTYL